MTFARMGADACELFVWAGLVAGALTALIRRVRS
jgi:hypothetical protein